MVKSKLLQLVEEKVVADRRQTESRQRESRQKDTHIKKEKKIQNG